MAFRFKITHVNALPHAGVGVLDGEVLAGQVLTGQEVQLVHEGQKMPLRVAGVVMKNDTQKQFAGLSLSFKLKQSSFSFARAGDELIVA